MMKFLHQNPILIWFIGVHPWFMLFRTA